MDSSGANIVLDEQVAKEIKERHAKMDVAGELLALEDIEKYCGNFRRRFGPDALKGLDGAALLEEMHGRKSRDSLVYWLEFKNDEEFPNVGFGSIAGGSALKFGFYQSAETQKWLTGYPGKQTALLEAAAIEFARKQRNQLVDGCRVLDGYRKDPEGADYQSLQNDLQKAASDISDTSWGHKYFHLLYPDLVSDFHASKYQNFALQMMLISSLGEGRYINGGRYLSAARQLEIHAVNLGTVLSKRNGRPHKYWRIGTTQEKKRDQWQPMLNGGFMAIGWEDLGDLSFVENTQVSKGKLKKLVSETYPSSPQLTGRSVSQIFKFVTTAKTGDVILAADGMTVIGVGKIVGDYYYKEDDVCPFPHRIPVDWISTEEWKMDPAEGLRTTFFEVRKYSSNMVEAERNIIGRRVSDKEKLIKFEKNIGSRALALSGIPLRIKRTLARKRQVILFGPPGTGKTYWAELTARELAARSWFDKSFNDLSEEDKSALVAGEKPVVEMCCFHPAYGYEDFIEGYRPTEKDGSIVFEKRSGIFKSICKRAEENPKRNYYLIIDEINRGDIPRIFGELLTVIEKSKRGVEIRLPLSGALFSVPDNLYVIGTMNTADRSIAMLDAALRRRFGFVELMPDISVLGAASVDGIPLGPWLDSLNERLVQHVGRDARNLQVGHSYLMTGDGAVRDGDLFSEIVRDDIIPLLGEYCYEDFDALEAILGRTLVKKASQRIASELFEPDRRAELVGALLEPCENITSSLKAVESEITSNDHDDDEDEDDGAVNDADGDK